MKEVVIQTWCDNHGRGTRATITRTVGIDGPFQEVDLCDTCDEQFVQGLVALVEAHGRKPEPPDPDVVCPITNCGHIAATRRALGQHLRTEHNRSIKEFAPKGGPVTPTRALRSA